MTKDSGSGSTPRRYPRMKPPPMKFRDASDPIYSNPTIITFTRNWTQWVRNAKKEAEATEKAQLAKDESDSEQV